MDRLKFTHGNLKVASVNIDKFNKLSHVATSGWLC